ncbi:MAG: ectoine synthase [Planctomycetes bacterium]|nr:ectoine synthase [Planctomycetota bacterium]
MIFQYDPAQAIEVPAPFNRIMTPMMMADNAGREIPFSIHFTEWAPGCKIDTHQHDSAMEAMYCVSGSGRAMADGEWVDFVPGTLLVADKGETHMIENTGSETLRVFCVFSPPVSADGLRQRALAAVREAGGTA